MATSRLSVSVVTEPYSEKDVGFECPPTTLDIWTKMGTSKMHFIRLGSSNMNSATYDDYIDAVVRDKNLKCIHMEYKGRRGIRAVRIAATSVIKSMLHADMDEDVIDKKENTGNVQLDIQQYRGDDMRMYLFEHIRYSVKYSRYVWAFNDTPHGWFIALGSCAMRSLTDISTALRLQTVSFQEDEESTRTEMKAFQLVSPIELNRRKIKISDFSEMLRIGKALTRNVPLREITISHNGYRTSTTSKEEVKEQKRATTCDIAQSIIERIRSSKQKSLVTASNKNATNVRTSCDVKEDSGTTRRAYIANEVTGSPKRKISSSAPDCMETHSNGYNVHKRCRVQYSALPENDPIWKIAEFAEDMTNERKSAMYRAGRSGGEEPKLLPVHLDPMNLQREVSALMKDKNNLQLEIKMHEECLARLRHARETMNIQQDLLLKRCLTIERNGVV
jgi:hypothetical protein